MFIKKLDLSTIIAPLNGLVQKTASPMVLSNFRMVSDSSTLTVEGADRDILVQNHIDCKLDKFDILINYETFAKSLKSFGATIELILSPNTLTLKSGKKTAAFALSQEEYVKLPESIKASTKLDGKKLAEILKQVALSIGDGQFGIANFNDNKIVSTNRQQLTLADLNLDKSFMLPKSGIDYLTKVLSGDIEFELRDKLVIFKQDNLQIFVNRHSMEFPDYSFLVDSEPFLTIIADTDALKTAITDLMNVNKEKAKMETIETGLKLSAIGTNGSCEVLLDCDIDGKALKMKFNPATLLTYVRSRKVKRTFLTIRQSGRNFKVIELSSSTVSHFVPEQL